MRRAALALTLLLSAGLTIATRAETPRVRPGLDVLAAKGFEPLKGKRVGLLINHTARDHEGTLLADLLLARDDVKLMTIFSPEHGLEGKKDEPVASGVYKGIPVVSLYGERKKPTKAELEALDVLVYDLQDVGARYYTYLATLGMSLEVAREAGIKVIVLDRPDPAGGEVVEGPILEEPLRKKFTSWSAIPTRYAMTIGEAARFMNEVEAIGAKLEVVPCEGWQRSDLWPATGLEWRPPSPNLRTSEAALLYTGLGILEATNLSVGRGTDTPFLVYGAPFVDGAAWAKALEARKLDGVAFEAVEFTPAASAHAKKPCRGVRVKVTGATKLRTVTTALHMLDTLRGLAKELKLGAAGAMLGERAALAELEKGATVEKLLERFAAGRAAFDKQRTSVLLYR